MQLIPRQPARSTVTIPHKGGAVQWWLDWEAGTGETGFSFAISFLCGAYGTFPGVSFLIPKLRPYYRLSYFLYKKTHDFILSMSCNYTYKWKNIQLTLKCGCFRAMSCLLVIKEFMSSNIVMWGMVRFVCVYDRLHKTHMHTHTYTLTQTILLYPNHFWQCCQWIITFFKVLWMHVFKCSRPSH